MNTVQNVWENLDWSILYSIIPALLCITLHELAHGYVAYRLGDPTAKRMGRLTLNPLRHIDLFGLAMMIFFHFGWAKPVPVDMCNFQDPKRGMALTALAGPVVNLLLSALALLLYGLLFVPLMHSAALEPVSEILLRTAYLSISLAIFNIIPIPPLDGSKVLFSVISDKAYNKLMRYERYGMLVLLLLVSTDLLGKPLAQAASALYRQFFHITEWAVQLVLQFA